MSSVEPIKIYMTHGVPYIWNADDWLKLRRDHRIIGCFDGAEGEGWTKQIHANLPFKLSTVEARYLLSMGIAEAYEVPELLELKQPVSEERYRDRLNIQDTQQFEMQKQKKRKEMEATIDKIIEGKRKKGKEVPMDPKEVIEAELSKFKELPSKTARFDLCDPWIDDSNVIPYTFPDFNSQLEKLRYMVFSDFHSKMKYFLTTGIKFGGDFIAYPGDPLYYHAEYIIMCEDSEHKFSDTLLLSQCRLATTLKKTLLVAAIDERTEKLLYRRIYRPASREIADSPG